MQKSTQSTRRRKASEYLWDNFVPHDQKKTPSEYSLPHLLSCEKKTYTQLRLLSLSLSLQTMSASIEEQFKAMPPITRGWFVAAMLTTTAVVLGFATPAQLYLSWDLVISKFHLWRLVTNFIFFGPFGMGFAFQLWIMCRMCYRYEENPFPVGTHVNAGRSSADMAMMLIFGATICVIVGYLMGKPFMGPPLVFMVSLFTSNFVRSATPPM